MSDEQKTKGVINYFDILKQTKQTFEEAEAQIKAESFSKRAELFRMSSDGEFSVRILPLVPNIDEDGNVLPMDRHGFEYPVHQQFLKIDLPKKKNEKKAKSISIPVVCATDKGVDKSIDLIDTYVKIAQELYPEDNEILELLEKSNYYGGLKWSYIHAMYVFDLSKKGERRGPLVWNASHSQYCDIRDAKQRLWIKEREKDPERDCPVCGFENAYPVNIIRETGKGNRTEYTIEIDRYTDDLTEDDLAKLFDAPRLPEQIYSFNRYSLEAEFAFLKQYDEKHEMEVTKEQDFLDAFEKLKGELDPEDKSHFDINKSGDDKDKDGGKDEITVNSLWAELDAIDNAGLSERSDEYQELREKIRQFIEDNELDIRLTRSKNNEALIREVEDAMEDKAKTPARKKVEDEPEEKKDDDEKKPAERSRSRRRADEPEDEPEPEKEDKKDEPEEEAPRERRRRPRPSDDDEPEEKQPAKEEPADEPEPEEERPSRTRERRRR